MKTVFNRGDYVKCKKWDGVEILAILEYTYPLDSSHCVVDVKTTKRFNIRPNDIKLATEEEAKEIKRLSKENNITLGKNIAESIKIKNNINKELEAALEAAD